MNLQDMRDVLKGQSRADEAIFWFCMCWNNGPDNNDLYRIMCETGYDPHFYALRKQYGSEKYLTPATDPEIVYCHELLRERWEKSFGPLREYPLRPIRFGTLKENDVVIHGPGRPFVCIPADWPCRVYLVGGELKVPCAEDKTGRSFHPFRDDGMGPDGYVVGFRR